MVGGAGSRCIWGVLAGAPRGIPSTDVITTSVPTGAGSDVDTSAKSKYVG